jgi:hypothetical protein
MSVMDKPLPRLAALPDAGLSTETAAAWLLVLPLVSEGVLPGVVRLEVAGLAVLAFGRIVISRRPLPRLAVERIFAVFAVLTLTVIGYVAFGQWPQGAGTAASYDAHAALWVITYLTVAVYAVLFYDAAVFGKVMWRACTIALWAGVITCAASRLTGHEWLVNPSHGTLRMVGTLTEPAEWAAPLAMILLLAVRRRSRLYVTLSLAGLLLADSPTCLLVMAVTVPLYFALASSWRYRVPLLAGLLVIIPAAVVFVQHADSQAWIASGSPGRVAVGRLTAGLQDIGSDGQGDANTRYANTTGAISAAREHGWLQLGAGPSADAVYFPAVKLPGAPPAGTNALWVSVLFDFGAWGLMALAVLVLLAAWRMRLGPVPCAVLLPFLVASMVNSAIPDWSVTALAVLLYGLRWGGQDVQA